MLHVGYSTLADCFRGYSKTDYVWVSDAVSKEPFFAQGSQVASAEVYILVVRMGFPSIIHYCWMSCGRYPVTISGPISEQERHRITLHAGRIRDKVQDWVDQSGIDHYFRGLVHLEETFLVLRTTEHALTPGWGVTPQQSPDPLSHD